MQHSIVEFVAKFQQNINAATGLDSAIPNVTVRGENLWPGSPSELVVYQDPG
ncbi:hypothetical protein CGERO_04250 [Corynebacterium gerontici]|uniref:Uncharacterized protein n=1 Tax=Corynebacterium gerontici TaxID=2079234 RepID=A0A3G6IZP5_9CORY|nr:hypothetical protein CGERO_04250 [Corynebacterium gerontici]